MLTFWSIIAALLVAGTLYLWFTQLVADFWGLDDIHLRICTAVSAVAIAALSVLASVNGWTWFFFGLILVVSAGQLVYYERPAKFAACAVTAAHGLAAIFRIVNDVSHGHWPIFNWIFGQLFWLLLGLAIFRAATSFTLWWDEKRKEGV